jgi:hypothetical protein
MQPAPSSQHRPPHRQARGNAGVLTPGIGRRRRGAPQLPRFWRRSLSSMLSSRLRLLLRSKRSSSGGRSAVPHRGGRSQARRSLGPLASPRPQGRGDVIVCRLVKALPAQAIIDAVQDVPPHGARQVARDRFSRSACERCCRSAPRYHTRCAFPCRLRDLRTATHSRPAGQSASLRRRVFHGTAPGSQRNDKGTGLFQGPKAANCRLRRYPAAARSRP